MEEIALLQAEDSACELELGNVLFVCWLFIISFFLVANCLLFFCLFTLGGNGKL